MIPFKQGVLMGPSTRSAKPTPDYIQVRKNGQELGIQASEASPIVVVFSHGSTHDYQHVETKTIPKAWVGLEPSTPYWLYWDLDLYTGKRTFGFTKHEPLVQPTIPMEAQEDQHWYDLTTNLLKVFVSGVFVQRIRVFAAKYVVGQPIEYFKYGSQVGVTIPSNPFTVVRDYTDSPVRDIVDGKAKFKSPRDSFTKVASSATNSMLETSTDPMVSGSAISAYSLVTQSAFNMVDVADATAGKGCFGLTVDDHEVGDDIKVVTEGYVTNALWNFSKPAGSSLYCGDGGELVTTPNSILVQRIGVIATPNTILLSIQQPIHVS